MNNIGLALCLALISITLQGNKGEDIADLITETQYHPDNCITKADDGDQVAVHYTGKLETGAVFDSSRQNNREPLEFQLGQGKVIPGWERGIKGMCVGMKRQLTIPPHLAYGKQGMPPTIPPNAVLIFETELMGLQKAEYDVITPVINMARFLAGPALVLYVIYYMYTKYQAEADKQVQEKREKKQGGKKRR